MTDKRRRPAPRGSRVPRRQLSEAFRRWPELMELDDLPGTAVYRAVTENA